MFTQSQEMQQSYAHIVLWMSNRICRLFYFQIGDIQKSEEDQADYFTHSYHTVWLEPTCILYQWYVLI